MFLSTCFSAASGLSPSLSSAFTFALKEGFRLSLLQLPVLFSSSQRELPSWSWSLSQPVHQWSRFPWGLLSLSVTWIAHSSLSSHLRHSRTTPTLFLWAAWSRYRSESDSGWGWELAVGNQRIVGNTRTPQRSGVKTCESGKPPQNDSHRSTHKARRSWGSQWLCLRCRSGIGCWTWG